MTAFTLIIAATGIIASDPDFVSRMLDCLLRVLLAFRKHEIVVVAADKVKRLRSAVGKRRRKPPASRKAKRRNS